MKKYTMETIVGLFLAVGLGFVAYMTVTLGHVSIFGGEETYTLYAPFTTVSGLRPGSSIEVFGIEAGRVGKLTMDQERHEAVVELRIQKGVKIYDDAMASIKTEGLIGEQYISIDPGGAGELLKPGDRITETTPALDIASIIAKYGFGEVKGSEETRSEESEKEQRGKP